MIEDIKRKDEKFKQEIEKRFIDSNLFESSVNNMNENLKEIENKFKDELKETENNLKTEIGNNMNLTIDSCDKTLKEFRNGLNTDLKLIENNFNESIEEKEIFLKDMIDRNVNKLKEVLKQTSDKLEEERKQNEIKLKEFNQTIGDLNALLEQTKNILTKEINELKDRINNGIKSKFCFFSFNT
jgi:ElaB/YqjD/DUF883 family membrane-anchored ribosome-binding protein